MEKKAYDEIVKIDVSDTILSTPTEIERFTHSTLHKDYQNEIDLRIAYLTYLLDDLECQFTGRFYDMFRGGKRNLLEMKLLFTEMIKNKTSDELELKEGDSNDVIE